MMRRGGVKRSGLSVRHLAHCGELISTLALKLTGTDALFFSFGDCVAKLATIFALSPNRFFYFADQFPPQTPFSAAVGIPALKLTVRTFLLHSVRRCFDQIFAKPTL